MPDDERQRQADRAPVPAAWIVRRAAVLGAGTMGAQIAALLANQGIPCDLLDLASDAADQPRNRLAEEGKERLLKLTPSPIYGRDVMDLIRPGNFSDDLPRLREADWVIEAVVERLDVKQAIWGQMAEHLRPDVIASSNTSGIPIRSIVEKLPLAVRRRVVGTHFFNPPRYLRLLEVTPTADTDPAVVEAISRFAEHGLGKGVVVARDVPNFIANRIGCYGFTVSLRAMEEFELGPDEVDTITGAPMGRPNSATFRTLDLVGIDVFVQICDNTVGFVTEDWEKEAYQVPGYVRKLVENGWTGDKGGQGFYKRVREGGATQILTLDPATMEYRPRRRAGEPSVAAAAAQDDVGARIRGLVEADDRAGRFAWRVLSQMLAYSAQKVGEVCDDIDSIDRAMRWGFGWELGPFEAWDAIGVAESVRRMAADGVDVPGWVTDMAAKGESFYRRTKGKSLQITPRSGYAPIATSPETIPLSELREGGRVIVDRPSATLYDLGDGIAYFDFHPPKQAIDRDFMEMLEETVGRAPRDFRGLVIGSQVPPNFCVGANVALMLDPARAGRWDQIDELVKAFQYGLLSLKRLSIPVVVAPYGATVGGGAEIALAASRVVAAAETYLGLVEIGAGIVPGGGGCKELLARALERGDDPATAVGRVFETIGLAKTSGSAHEARSLGFLRPEDSIVPNKDHLLYQAKQRALALAADGYGPPPTARLPVVGAELRKVLIETVEGMVSAGQATDHDLTIARELAYVLTGGDRPAGSEADEEHFLELEREALVKLCHEAKSQERLDHIMQTGRPLRN